MLHTPLQEEYFGSGALQNLQHILHHQQVKSIFLVRGKTSYAASGAEEQLKGILKKYEVIHFTDFSTDPKVEDLKKGISLYRKKATDITLAVGGGSALDVAKAIALLAEQNEEPERYIRNELSLKAKKKALIAVPTTSGAGSEATHFAVVYIDKVKYSLTDASLLPEYVIIDPSLTFSLSSYVTACTGMDALAQAVESYWCIHSTKISKQYAREAVLLALEYLETAVNKPTPAAREGMAKSANLAGKAINLTKTTASHALSYPMTSYFQIPHGHAVALTLGEVFMHNALIEEEDCLDRRGKSYVIDTLQELFQLFNVRDAQEMQQWLKKNMQAIGLPQKLSALGIRGDEDLELIAKNVNSERGQNNPRKLTTASIRQILEQIY